MQMHGYVMCNFAFRISHFAFRISHFAYLNRYEGFISRGGAILRSKNCCHDDLEWCQRMDVYSHFQSGPELLWRSKEK